MNIPPQELKKSLRGALGKDTFRMEGAIVFFSCVAGSAAYLKELLKDSNLVIEDLWYKQ